MDLDSARSQFIRLWEIQNQLLLNDIDSELRNAVSYGKRECHVYIGDVTTTMHDVVAYYEQKGFHCELYEAQKIMVLRGWSLS
ncbi:MAG: hypothetical protein Q4E77_08405 [Conchiformibius sp.]|nr:hypothetical protein [Conchiformibius sp.]